jgi:hypothetical protein
LTRALTWIVWASGIAFMNATQSARIAMAVKATARVVKIVRD